ncbi:DUF6221 family protein [Nonomuraea sp. NPDC059023]|uniref:DUF6221 family protein n=1 Tax=unclassified Nonomuraea TaxID=2593643 RepID=UPI0036A7DFE6
MRISMESSLAALLEQPKGHLATAANAASHPSPLPIGPQIPPQPKKRERPEPESVAWLRSVITEDMATAKAVDSQVWTAAQAQEEWYIQLEQGEAFGGDAEWGDLASEEATLIAIHDPRNTIARCEADLGLLDLHKYGEYGECVTCDVGAQSCGCCGWGDFPCDTIKTVMSGYRHRDGFKPEWVSD